MVWEVALIKSIRQEEDPKEPLDGLPGLDESFLIQEEDEEEEQGDEEGPGDLDELNLSREEGARLAEEKALLLEEMAGLGGGEEPSLSPHSDGQWHGLDAHGVQEAVQGATELTRT